MTYYSILALIFISFSLITFFLLWLIRRRVDPTVKRLRDLEEAGGARFIDEDKALKDAIIKHKDEAKLTKLFSEISKFTRRNEKKVSKIRDTLVQAGIHGENSVEIYIGLRIFCTLILALSYAYISYLADKPLPLVILISFFMALFGYSIPSFLLNSRISRRRKEIAASLPDALDLLVICVEAGLALNAALVRVGEELQLRSRTLSDELLLVNQDIRTGMSREKALRNLSNRNNVENLRILVGSLILADRLGTNIADTLRAQADSLRTRMRQRAEEQAARAGIKMLFPLVLFLLPVLFIVTLGPGLITVSKIFSNIIDK